MKRKSAAFVIGLIVAMAALAPVSVSALQLQGEETFGDGDIDGSGEQVVENGGKFWWADADGNGTPGDAVSSGLDLNGHNLDRNNTGKDIFLDLDDDNNPSTIGGDVVANGGFIYTYDGGWNGVRAGTLTITNAANVSLLDVDTHIRNTGDGGVYVYHTGNFSARDILNYGNTTDLGMKGVHLNGNLLGAQTVEDLQNTCEANTIQCNEQGSNRGEISRQTRKSTVCAQ